VTCRPENNPSRASYLDLLGSLKWLQRVRTCTQDWPSTLISHCPLYLEALSSATHKASLFLFHRQSSYFCWLVKRVLRLHRALPWLRLLLSKLTQELDRGFLACHSSSSLPWDSVSLAHLLLGFSHYLQWLLMVASLFASRTRSYSEWILPGKKMSSRLSWHCRSRTQL
jgi:hypothetical protein